MKTIEQDGYAPVQCDEPLPCPFCGGEAVLKQMAHTYTYDRKGKRQRICIVASTRRQTADTFWFACAECRATTGPHQDTAQKASEIWNKRKTIALP